MLLSDMHTGIRTTLLITILRQLWLKIITDSFGVKLDVFVRLSVLSVVLLVVDVTSQADMQCILNDIWYCVTIIC